MLLIDLNGEQSSCLICPGMKLEIPTGRHKDDDEIAFNKMEDYLNIMYKDREFEFYNYYAIED